MDVEDRLKNAIFSECDYRETYFLIMAIIFFLLALEMGITAPSVI